MYNLDASTWAWGAFVVIASLWLIKPNDKTQSEAQRRMRTLNKPSSPLSLRWKRWQSLWHGRQFLEEAHARSKRTSKSCYLPGLFGDNVVLPPELATWLASQSESQLSAKHAQLDFLNIQTTMLDPAVGGDPIHERVVRRDSIAHLEQFPTALMDEIEYAFAEVWGTDTRVSQRIDLDGTIRHIVARTVNRVFVGVELCRNQDYLKNSIAHVRDVSVSGLLLNLTSDYLKPIVAPLVTLPNKIHYSRSARYLKPYFSDVLAAYSEDPESLPPLFSTWSVKRGMEPGVSIHEKKEEMLSRRLMALNFAAIHTSTMTLTALILDLFSDSQQECIETLRREAHSSSMAHESTWSRARLRQLTSLDSALHESMRLSGFSQRALSRKVMAPGGLVLPDGTYVPQNTILCVNSWMVHHDAKTYEDPFTYRYDRFVRTDTPADDAGTEDCPPKPYLPKMRETAVDMSPEYLLWGMGKHACPGRFFAVDLIKLIAAFVIAHYDIEPLEKRPDNFWLEYTMVPPIGIKLNVRRRGASLG